jgi:hypothetical protein
MLPETAFKKFRGVHSKPLNLLAWNTLWKSLGMSAHFADFPLTKRSVASILGTNILLRNL